NAGRMQDLKNAAHAFQTRGITHALIGSEAFRDRAFFKTNRPVHVDYARILVGAGAIGLGLYMSVHFHIVWKTLIRSTKLNSYRSRVAFAVVCGLISGSFLVSFSSQIYVFSSLSWLFLMLVAINGWLCSSVT